MSRAVASRDWWSANLAGRDRFAGDLRRTAWRGPALIGNRSSPEVDTAVAAGLQPASTRPGWRHLKHFDGYATSFWVSPRDITSETLDRSWLHDTDATVVTIRLTAAADGAEVSAWVRYQAGAAG